MTYVAGAAIAGVLVAGLASTAALAADIQTRTIEYDHDGTTYIGYLAIPAPDTPHPGGNDDDDDRPGVLVVHEWWGLNDYTKKRANMLAELGYVAFAVDMFGEGKTTDDPKQAQAWAGPLYKDREEMRDRVEEGFEVLEDLDDVDDDRIAAIGYCFGGTVALELAYAEADDDEDDGDDDLRGIVSFHGNPMPPLPGDQHIATRVLLLHGGADPMVKTDDVEAVAAAIRERGGDAKVTVYPDAKHGFTNPAADEHGLEGVAYQKEADDQSWQALQVFLRDVLRDDDRDDD